MANSALDATEAKSVVELIRGASLADLAIVSFVVLPILIGAWILLFSLVGVFPQSLSGRLWLVVGLTVFYVAAVIVMKRSEGSRSRKLRTVRRVYNTLEGRPAPNQGFGSFDYIKERIDETFTEEFMLELIEEFPDLFIKGRSRKGKDAIKLVLDSPEKLD